MKTIWVIALLFIVSPGTKAQKNVFGNYQDHFGRQVELRSDSTFKFQWRLELSTSWSAGTWTSRNDTLFFSIKPIYDTLRYSNESPNRHSDSLVLSVDDKIDVISSEKLSIEPPISSQQNKEDMPGKLFFQKDRLYTITPDGKLNTEKVKLFWSKNKHVPWFERQK